MRGGVGKGSKKTVEFRGRFSTLRQSLVAMMWEEVGELHCGRQQAGCDNLSGPKVKTGMVKGDRVCDFSYQKMIR